MIKDTIISFRENFRKKSHNPFWGTFLVIWIIQNWELIYSLFNFEASMSLNDKLNYIESYFEADPIFLTTFNTIWMTFVALVISYSLVNISRLIINFFEKVVTPWVYKVTDEGSIVLKTDYEELKQDYIKINDRLRQEIDKRKAVETERDKLEEDLVNLRTELSPEDSIINEIAKEIKNEEQLSYQFENVIETIARNKPLYDEEGAFFAKKGLIEFEQNDVESEDRNFYKLTDRGKKLRDILL